ncbi:MAG: hypothetical protein QXO76_00295 [Thermoproteota archaeon]
MLKVNFILLAAFLMLISAVATATGEESLPSDSTNYGGGDYWRSKRGAAVVCGFTFPASSNQNTPHGRVTVITTDNSSVTKSCQQNSSSSATVYCGGSLAPTITVTPRVVGSHFSLRGFVGWAEGSGNFYDVYGYYCVAVGDYCFGSAPSGVNLYGPADPNLLAFDVRVECHSR